MSKIIRFDVIFEIEEYNEQDFRDSFKEFLKTHDGELKLYTIEEIKSVEEMLGL